LFAPDRPRAISAYQRFMTGDPGTNPDSSPLDECNDNDRRILGSDDFARKLLRQEWKPKSRKSLDVLVQEACENFACTSDDLSSTSRRSDHVAARAWVVCQAVTAGVASVAQVARRFNRDESSLRHALKTHREGR